jgi:hypothetical protein
MWARRIEREIDIGRKPTSKAVQGIRNFADLIDFILKTSKQSVAHQDARRPPASTCFGSDWAVFAYRISTVKP